METLKIIEINENIENSSFECGVESINTYVKESYFPMLIQHAYAYSIMAQNRVLGYYQVLFRDIEMDFFSDDIAEYDAGIKESKISAVHIRYIAIDKKYQRRKIGTSILHTVIKDVRELANKWPIRVITIDARVDLVPWYQKEGFVKMKKNTIGQDGVSVAMYFDCKKYSEELREYVSSCGE